MTADTPGTTIIHGGVEKAASTYMQQVVFPTLKLTKYKPDLTNALISLGEAHSDHLPDEIVSALQSGGENRILFSAEGFGGKVSAHGIEIRRDPILALVNARRLFGPNLILLTIIRRQDDAIDSMIRYKQRYLSDPDSFLVDFPVRRSWLTGVNTYVSLTGRLLDTYDYYRYLAIAREILGKRNVRVLVYENLATDPSLFFDDLGEVLGEDLSEFVVRSDERLNSRSEKYGSLPRGYVPMPHIVRRINNLSGYRLEKLLPRRRNALTDIRRREILNIFSAGNERLANLFNLDLARYGYC